MSRSYKFIKPLKEKPKIERKTYAKAISKDIIAEFLESKEKYAVVNFDTVKDDYKTPTSLARALGRSVKNKGVKVYTDKGSIYLEKV